MTGSLLGRLIASPPLLPRLHATSTRRGSAGSGGSAGAGGSAGTGGGAGKGGAAGNGGSGGSAPVCQPHCTGRVCGDDGCGSVCGTCGSGTTCNTTGQCVAPPPPPAGCSEAEPNDAPSQAKALCAGGAKGTIAQPWDHDTWSFTQAATGKVKLGLATSHDYYLTVYRMQNGYAYELGSYGPPAQLTLDAGTYVVEVWGGNGDYSATDTYTLTVAH